MPTLARVLSGCLPGWALTKSQLSDFIPLFWRRENVDGGARVSTTKSG